MKLCRFGPAGQERPGMIDAAGGLRDLSALKARLTGADISPASLSALAALDATKLPLVQGNPRLGPPLEGIGKYICIGLNYSDHAAESNLPIPPEPIIFMKAVTAICGPDDDTVMPQGGSRLDWEVELAIVIGTIARNVTRESALDHVAGWCLANDISERAFQMQSPQWDKGKGCDTFGPLGPWLVTRDEIADVNDLDMWLDVNGERRQTGNTGTMIFDPATIVSYVSRFMTLMPGDVIATGTPPGVGMGMKPDPVWLKPGDVVELGIEGLGRQRQTIRDSQPG
ncbi:fumarylacetoacetate hydrolase family protein [Paracoccus thiocyanatus]|uniref:2-hydroxyhepta-2,4-diene-1,7-dioate isomerase n=1 Tax=Paracoccus thiocyanatus TaxID=34006 RepID=A0A3D8PHK4_9RHOB|nr:fumarylacetoacetate hydrolase family protein [Paracoccus thiocyanatus]RDW14665.1 2-hydroxyhepta-2,4-diene-1,7-dioate isomerase [Paracoccus thiocyanatus]